MSGRPQPPKGKPEGTSIGLKIGLTGGLASGKSTVARWLADAGFAVVDADRLVAELYAPGGEGAAAVERLFGAGYLEDGGAVDRARLAERVFSDGAARRELEAAIHPLVRRRFGELAAGIDGGAVLEATRLVEAGYGPDFDLVVTVEAEPEVRLRRAIERGMAEADARSRLAAQGDGAERRAAAHRVLRNDGDLAALRAQVDGLLRELSPGAAGGLTRRPSAPGAAPAKLGPGARSRPSRRRRAPHR